MQGKKLVYELKGKFGGGFRVYLVPKQKRDSGVDGIELLWRSSKEAKSKVDWHYMAMKDWEALSIIEGLVKALLSKKNKIF